ncbi:MAG: hypothetical protein PHD07_07610 [Bacteroidales bacterium]|nr:hypothetical protein [Bacteroidales bacterium]MDD3201203.1 hypothetical protein [Bacteroidales bacterium]
MKQICLVLSLCVLFALSSCTKDDLLKKYTTDMDGVLIEYWHNDNGSWSTADYTYKYRLVLTGRLPSAVVNSEYVVLSNTKEVTFDQCAAQIISSSTADWFDKSKTVLVECH